MEKYIDKYIEINGDYYLLCGETETLQIYRGTSKNLYFKEKKKDENKTR